MIGIDLAQFIFEIVLTITNVISDQFNLFLLDYLLSEYLHSTDLWLIQ